MSLSEHVFNQAWHLSMLGNPVEDFFLSLVIYPSVVLQMLDSLNNSINVTPDKRSYRAFIKYCVFFRIFKNIPNSGLSLFSHGVSVCTHTR